MTSLSPATRYHAELREHLDSVGRVLVLQRAAFWSVRGIVLGLVAVLGLEIWSWTRQGPDTPPLLLLVSLPLAAALALGLASLLVRLRTPDLARRVDRAAGLHERATTALELGTRGTEHPLALAQMRDAVEHLARLQPLDAFPFRAPKRELVAAAAIFVLSALVAFAPNPWLLRARAANPAITVAREQAQRVQRTADSIDAQQDQELEALRDTLQKGARTIDARSSDPESALNSLEDLEQKVRQMSAGDDQFAAALAAVASALANDPSTSKLGSAINTGDLREISRATQDLAQSTESMDGQERASLARTLRDASNRAQRASPSVAGTLADAASALDGQDGQSGQSGAAQAGQQRSQNGQSAQDALNQLSRQEAAAAQRSSVQSQLESSRNALERALGRSQSRSGSSSSSGRSAAGQRSQQAQDGSSGQDGAGGQGQTGEGSQQGGDGSEGGQEGDGNQPGGSGYGTGSSNPQGGPNTTPLDTITRPEQVGSDSFSPDTVSDNPYLGEGASTQSKAGEENVQPSIGRSTTQGSDSSSIPLGLRDLVKDYFSSLDQK